MRITTYQREHAESVRTWLCTALERQEGTENEQAVMRMVWYGLDCLLDEEPGSIVRAHAASQKAVMGLDEAAQVMYGYIPKE